MAMTAVSSANVAVMESGEVGMSAVYRRYNKGLGNMKENLWLMKRK
jgi:hypothetical protein